VTGQRGARGFTLVEVLVALFILAILTGMAFRGVDAIARAKDHALAATDRTLKLNNGMSQFEYDASQIVNTQVVDPLSFDGATLRLTRRTPDGLQLVLWTLQAHRWQRWASAPFTHVPQLQEAWLRSQQWESISGNAITVLDDVGVFQVYTYCPGDGWGNVQSSCSGGANANGGGAPSPGGGASAPAGGGGAPNRGAGAGNFPTGIRIQIGLPEGNLVRERELPAL
jgi:general secretion pathway protein J